MTAKSVVAAVVAFSGSLYVKVKVVPAVLTAAELYVGGVKSTFELFGDTPRDASDAASFPAAS